MAEKKRRMSAERWVILGLLIVLVSMLGGFAIASGAPSNITTCTKASNGKMKIITSGGVAKCTAKGKGTAATWDNHAIVGPQLAQIPQLNSGLNTACQRYLDLFRLFVGGPITPDEFTTNPLGPQETECIGRVS